MSPLIYSRKELWKGKLTCAKALGKEGENVFLLSLSGSPRFPKNSLAILQAYTHKWSMSRVIRGDKIEQIVGNLGEFRCMLLKI